ncbi:MAG: sulfite exporter TauE/SafE family protein [Labilithrix sp.]|nr:sulfite exporter TauE/SafE family protein [Labilithrix sp.]
MTALDVCELLLIAGASFGMSYLGAAVGLVLGHFRIVLLTYVLGGALAGAATSMAISTVSTFSGVVSHARGGRVQLGPLLLIGGPSAIAAYVVSRFAQGVDPRALKFMIAAMLVVAAVDLLRRRRLGAGSMATSVGPGSSLWQRLALQAGVGFLLGAVSGLVGLLLGSLRLPTMVRLGVKPSTAVGTNMAIGAVTGLSAGASAIVGGHVDLAAFVVIAPFALLGSHLGAKKTANLDPVALKTWIALALLATSLIMFGDLLFGPGRAG